MTRTVVMSIVPRTGRRKGRLVWASLLGFGIALAAIGPGALPGLAKPTHAAAPQPDFASPEDAVAAFVQAARAADLSAMRRILGPGSDRLVESGDPVADTNARNAFLADYDAAHKLQPDSNGHMTLVVGQDAWPEPVPIVQTAKGWHFDSAAGVQEIVNRRIGRNELLTIQALLSAVEAEQDYFDRVKRGTGTGTGTYAQRFFSTADAQDGLYWEAAEGEPPSPLGPLIDQARDEGYPGDVAPDGKPRPYHGYLFRILTSQGPEAPGGAKSYLKDDALTDGFAILAWPADFGNSGVMTFLVDQDGVVFQKNLGPDTAKTVATIKQFDPDVSWVRVDVTD